MKPRGSLEEAPRTPRGSPEELPRKPRGGHEDAPRRPRGGHEGFVTRKPPSGLPGWLKNCPGQLRTVKLHK